MSRYYINQLFTEDEIELLKDFLMRKRGTGVFVLEQPFPIKTYYVDEYTGKRRFYQPHYRFENEGNTIHLDVTEDYELHFPASGNYHPGDGFPSEKLPEECIDDGVEFVRKILGEMRYKAKWSDRRLAKILKKIYSKEGFYVSYRPPIIIDGKDMVMSK